MRFIHTSLTKTCIVILGIATAYYSCENGLFSKKEPILRGRKMLDEDVHRHELRWNWDEINPVDVTFPTNFLWGAAVCEFQTSGAVNCPDSNWAYWENSQKLEPSGKVCDSWHLYKEDIAILSNLGLNSYRFSVDWSRIEPRQGEINQAALQHYVAICEALHKANITPIVTLHHFTHPQWFEELGAFEKKENIKYFVAFSKIVYQALHEQVGLWCTINEPAIYTFQGYTRGVFPPGKSGFSGLKLASKVLKNMLDAHVEVYYALKAMPGGDEAKIGIVHQYLKFDRFHSGYSPVKAIVEHSIAKQLAWVNQTIIDYFEHGVYKFQVTCVVNKDDTKKVTQEVKERRQHALDYIGINYYSHIFLRLHHRWKDMFGPGFRAYDIPTDMPYALYAEGLYSAVKHMSQLGVPIYITENGAPTKDEKCRELWLKRYLYALNKAMKEGCDVRGYIYWSLLDNYEWDMGSEQHFGLCKIDAETHERILRPSSMYYKKIVLKSKRPKSMWQQFKDYFF